jgi:hypothetical protein
MLWVGSRLVWYFHRVEERQPSRVGARPGRWRPLAGVLLVLAAVVLGGRVADSALSVPGPPVQVAAGVSVRPLSGWRSVRQGQGVLLTRGSGSLSVLPTDGGADPATLAGEYVRQVLQPNAQGLSLSQGLQTVHLGGGQVGVRFAYQGTFRGQGRATPLQGEVTAVAGPRAAAVFDAWAAPEVYEYERADVQEMVQTAEVG